MQKYFSLIFLLAITSCNETPASLKEAPDSANSPEQVGVTEVVKWDEIRDIREAHIRSAWYGDGLGMSSLGLARRWTNRLNHPLSKTFYENRFFEKQLNDTWTASQTITDDSYALSPAEKHDWVTHAASANPTPEIKAKIADRIKIYDEQIKPQVSVHELKIHKIMESISPISKQAQNLGETITEKEKAKQEALDQGDTQLAESIEAELVILRRDLHNLYATMEELYKEVTDLGNVIREIEKTFHKGSYSTINAIKDTNPLLFDAWNDFLRLSTTYSGNWGWFGHCHGAAAAGIYEPRTQNAVLIKHEGREVFFFERDIRNIMVKAWADQAPDAKYFAGRRCYHSSTESNEQGRIIDGSKCSQLDDKKNCTVAGGGEEIFVTDNQISTQRTLKFKESSDGEEYLAKIRKQVSRDLYKVEVNSLDGSPLGLSFIKITTACRDVNPMTLHLALTHQLAKGRPFVIDGSNSSSVWNAAISGFKVDFLPIKLRDGTDSEPGVPVAIEDFEDRLKSFRAPGTKSIVALRSNLAIHVDHSPSLQFNSNSAPATQTITYTYSLELDSEGRIIGGEWGGLEHTDNPVYNGTPDFIWFFRGDKPELKPGLVDLKLLDTLRRCSRSPITKQKVFEVRMRKVDPSTGETTYVDTTEAVYYAECSLD
jgi:hypothetical protein